jgi:DNA-binding CsgD family transcriptional regulator
MVQASGPVHDYGMTPTLIEGRGRRSSDRSFAHAPVGTSTQPTAVRIAATTTYTDDLIPRRQSTLEQRGAPQFFLVDHNLTVLAASDGEGIEDLIAQAIASATSWVDAGATIVPLVEDTFLRIVPLEGAWPGAKIVFIEHFKVRGGIAAAAKRFDLTRREIDVLRLLISSKSNVEIAQTLFISQGTVGNHVKNIFRKMKSSRRTEVMAKLFGSTE